MNIIKFSILLFIASLWMGCPNGGETNSSCVNEDNLAQESTCLAASVITQGNLFPVPVGSGGTLSLSMKIGAVDSQFNPLAANISTKVFSVNGQLVTQQNAGSVQSNANFQNVPVLTNISLASGTYYLEVTVDVGACGNKIICLSENKFTVAR